MTTRIVYDQATQTGKMLAQAVNAVLSSVDDLRRVKKLLDAASSGADWAAVATEVGGSLTLQQAQDLWTITATALQTIDVPAVAELSRLDQG